MSFYRHHILPPLLNFAMRQKSLQPFRDRVIQCATGNVLEIGIGSGLNLPLYGSGVRSVIGVEPSVELLAMARQQVELATVPIDLLCASAEELPIDSSSVDTVVTTWTLAQSPTRIWLCKKPGACCGQVARCCSLNMDVPQKLASPVGRTGWIPCGAASPVVVI